jgi:hypothetical protein
VNERRAEGVLITGVYGPGKSSVAQVIAYLLEQRGEPYALLDLDDLSWAGTGTCTPAPPPWMNRICRVPLTAIPPDFVTNPNDTAGRSLFRAEASLIAGHGRFANILNCRVRCVLGLGG